jgi:CheY-like chemotaxis protein
MGEQRQKRCHHILLVESDSEALDPLVTALEGYGHTVAAARSGEEALAMLSSGLRPTVLMVGKTSNRTATAVELLGLCDTNAALREIPTVLTTDTERPQIDLAASGWHYLRKSRPLEDIESVLALHHTIFFPISATDAAPTPSPPGGGVPGELAGRREP